jgi:diguanylate cyclase (GGDEF)-like protein
MACKSPEDRNWRKPLISLKKFLDMQASGQFSALETEDLLPTTMECYRSVLVAVGKSAVQGCPAIGAELERWLQKLESRISVTASPESLKETEQQIESELRAWGGRTAEHFKAKADDAKELLLALARTAESVGDRDQCYTNQFKGLTARLETIANLDDVSEIRSSLVKRVVELKTSVDQMARDSQRLVAQLQAEVCTYETRLKTVERMILKDELTGAENRRSVEERIQWSITKQQTFCVIMVDLNQFKQVNDQYGHLAGDDLLKQFAKELQSNTRSSDIVGRWGGDEFLVLLACDEDGARIHIQRIKDWVFGKYTVKCGTGKDIASVYMDAAIGLAAWNPNKTMQQLIAEADAAMYRDKHKVKVANPPARRA